MLTAQMLSGIVNMLNKAKSSIEDYARKINDHLDKAEVNLEMSDTYTSIFFIQKANVQIDHEIYIMRGVCEFLDARLPNNQKDWVVNKNSTVDVRNIISGLHECAGVAKQLYDRMIEVNYKTGGYAVPRGDPQVNNFMNICDTLEKYCSPMNTRKLCFEALMDRFRKLKVVQER